MILLLAVIIGLILGLLITVPIPSIAYMYIALLALATLHSLLDGIYAKAVRRFNNAEFLLGWFSNVAVALLLYALGEAIGVDLGTAVVVILGMRIFVSTTNLRQVWIKRMRKRQRTIRVWMEQTGHKAEELPLENIQAELNERHAKVEALRERARMLRLEADSLLNEADVLFEQETMAQLVHSSALRKAEKEKTGNVTDEKQIDELDEETKKTNEDS